MHITRHITRANNLLLSQVRLASSIQSHQPTKAPKVADNIVWINVIDPYGLKQTVPCFEGESVLYSLKNNQVDIKGYCGGGDQ